MGTVLQVVGGQVIRRIATAALKAGVIALAVSLGDGVGVVLAKAIKRRVNSQTKRNTPRKRKS